MKPYGQYPDDKEPPKAVTALLEQVERDGGHVLAVYREPVGDHWQAFCLLPLEKVAPTPYQRDLSPTHAKRLHGRGEEDRPVRRPDRGGLAAARRLLDAERPPPPHGPGEAQGRVGARDPDPRAGGGLPDPRPQHGEGPQPQGEVARGDPHVPRRWPWSEPKEGEEDFAFQFEAPHFITLGLLYEENKRFAGGAFAPILRRVDKFLKGRFRRRSESARSGRPRSGRPTRPSWAAVAALKKRGISHPFVKNYVLARTTPLTRARKTLPSFDQTFAKL